MRFFLSVSLLILSLIAFGDECATSYAELGNTEKLSQLKTLLPKEGLRGFVNETKGSYFFIHSGESGFKILFYTTGLWDLYGIQREGGIRFCDTGKEIKAIGLGYSKKLELLDGGLRYGGHKKSQTYQPGPMPKALREINDVKIRDIAAETDI